MKDRYFVRCRTVAVIIAVCLLSGAFSGVVQSAEELYVAKPLTEVNSFTTGVEGPAVDRDGNLYAVNFEKQHTIGKVSLNGKPEVFVTLPGESVGNGLRFDREGFLYVADYPQHNVLKIDPKTREISVFAHQPEMNQPNDLTITGDGVLFASDPNWGNSTGQIWRIDRDGSTHRVAADMGTTNGIEVSPDNRTLYVNESVQRNVWAFEISATGELKNKKLIRQFPDHGFDGMRCDVDGNLYITRHGKGTVVIMTPAGDLLREIDVLGKHPTNVCFGGADGRTVYVTEVDHQRIVQFRAETPGLEWQRLRAK